MVYDSVAELGDILILAKVIDTSALTLVIGIVGLYYGIRGIVYYNKKDKEK